jgi:hypothetical protein
MQIVDFTAGSKSLGVVCVAFLTNGNLDGMGHCDHHVIPEPEVP